MDISNIILNIIMLATPEEFFMVFMTLMLLERYDFFDIYTIKTNLARIFFIAVIPCSLFFTFTLLLLESHFQLRILINLIVISLFTMILTKERYFLKHLASNTISFLFIISFEVITLTLLIYIFKINICVEGIHPLTNFWISLPGRIADYGFLYIIYLNKNAITKVQILNIWTSNKIFRRLIYICLTFNFMITTFILKKFALEKFIQNLSFENQIFIITVVFMMFTFIIILPWITLYSVYPSEKLRNNLYKQ